MEGLKMNSKIVETLETICDKENPQDKKLLLLAELVETKCEALAENQSELKKSFKNTDEKLDKLTDILEKIERNETACPVYQNRKNFEQMTFLIKYPRMSFFIFVGIFALLIGVLGNSTIDLIKFLFNI